jgi:ATP-binding cassette subfamily F protein 3
VVEGESPYKLAPGVRGGDDDAEDSSDSESEETGVAPGIVYRLTKGQLKKLDGGMEQYEDIAARFAAKLAREGKSV